MHTPHVHLHTRGACTYRSPSARSLLNPAARLNPRREPTTTPHSTESQSQGPLQGFPGTLGSVPALVQGWSPDAPKLPLCLCAGSSWAGVLLLPLLTSSDPDHLHLQSSSCPDLDLSPQCSPPPSVIYLFTSFARLPHQNVYRMRTRISVSSPAVLLQRTVPGTWMLSANIC